MKNKTIIRRENIAGSFTTINYSILRDKNLDPIAKILFIEILSDSDSFKFSEKLFINRMGISKTTYYRAMDNIIDNGYMRKTKIGNSQYNYYTINEFGNLGNKNIASSEESTLQNESNVIEPQANVEENSVVKINKLNKDDTTKKIMEWLKKYMAFNTDDISNHLLKLLDDGFDFYQIKSRISNLIEKEKKQYFNDIVKQINDSTSIDAKGKKEALKLLKDAVFNKNIKITFYSVRKTANENINRRRPIDPESAADDHFENC